METFPQLRGKLSGRCCRWEPGVRVRKKAREPRSRSNSRSKVGGGGGSSGIQDSGFCTESKKTTDQEAEDELWNLLDLIHTKGTKLRLEVESLQDKYQSSRRSRSILGLRQEKEMLLDRVTEMEAENLANLAQTNQLLAKLGALAAEKRDIEQQLRAAVTKLGRLDGILSSPRMKMTCPRGVTPDKEKTAAILREADVVELQRHLITTTYENQVRLL
ncbi:hypothetical protein AAG570_003895 [Ranatra chinensis]|uniref:Uncharacterized protein n=1 Tax=Ranatra chinensis TaxID=642074 RepID=A0ABD0Y4H3_9HEMI